MSKPLHQLVSTERSYTSKARIKSEAISTIKEGSYYRQSFPNTIQISNPKIINDGVELMVRAWDRADLPIGFGENGSTETERFRIFNPPILIPDPQGNIIRSSENGQSRYIEDPYEALFQVLEHNIKLVGRQGAKITPGSIGNTVSTFFPAAGSADPVDGRVERGSAIDEVFSSIRNGSGDGFNNADASANSPRLVSTATTNKFSLNRVSVFVFDTSAIPSGDIVSTAILSLFGNSQANGLGSPDIHIAGATTGSNSTLAAGDYENRGHTSFALIQYGSWSTSAYNDFTLNASGIAAVNKGAAARTKYSAQLSWDINNSFTGTWASVTATHFGIVFADTAGTTSDPKLVVTHVSGLRPRTVIINQAINRASSY